MRRTLAIAVVAGVAAVAILSGVNCLMLGAPLADVLESDPRNSGIDIRAHYGNYVFPATLVLDLVAVGGESAPADVFRVLLQYASRLQEDEFEAVHLSFQGETKFLLKGAYFRELGLEYGTQNPVYTMRTFPENVYTENWEQAFPTWSGGLLGVMGKQMEDFSEFHRQWYIEHMESSDLD